jgi:hypothetical protein
MAKEGLEIDITVKADNAAQQINAVSKSLNGLNTSTKGANITLTNFGRVIQDAPFGILGIANNIDPLIQSFQNLKKESGSTGGALKALAGSLAGPAGIAIAISAVTSILISFGPEISKFFGLTESAGEAAAAAAKNFDTAAASVANEASQVEKLVAVLQSETTSRREKQAAINDLNRISSVYFDGLKLEGNIVQGLDPAYKAYVASLLNVARAKAAQNKISELYTKRLELESKIVGEVLTSALGKVAAANQKIDKAFKNQQQVGFVSLGLTKDENAAFAANIQITELDNQIKKLATATIPAFDSQSKAAATSTQKLGENSKKAAADIQKAAIANDDFAKSIEPIIELNNKLTGQDQFKLSISAQILKAEKQLQEILSRKLTDTERLIALKQQEILLQQKAKISDTIAGQPTSAGAGLLGGPNARNLQIADEAIGINNVNAALALTQERLANVQSAFTLVGGAVDQAFNALANGQDPLEALKQSLKQLLIQLAKAAVFALILSAVSGGAGAAGGLSFLTAFKGLLGFKASGGGVRGGGAFMVGENGPELFVPGANGAMVNNNALRGAGAGAVSFEIRGDVLFGLLRKNGQNRAANFG